MTAVREPDRLVSFTDAIVAIAATLLVLPLVDVVGEGATAADVLADSAPQIGVFLLSFVVIMRLWLAHHRLFRHVRALTGPLVWCNLGWLLTVVLLPFPTEMAGRFGTDRLTVALYTGTVLLASALLTAMAFLVARNPDAADAPPAALRTGAAATTALITVALLLSLAVPALSYWAFLLLALSPTLQRRFRAP
ncbi:TMEM175 family protein [Actinomadura flavalba]|uniref:TMEM175 family protein n=1 Tax=Actinomadura flavalba TaxID=1120938 RepID=UPI0003702898|nr:TMEM175 family protein [Actinomadura flavalba]